MSIKVRIASGVASRIKSLISFAASALLSGLATSVFPVLGGRGIPVVGGAGVWFIFTVYGFAGWLSRDPKRSKELQEAPDILRTVYCAKTGLSSGALHGALHGALAEKPKSHCM